MDTIINKIIALAKKKGSLRSSDLTEIGASRTLLPCLVKRGIRRRSLLSDCKLSFAQVLKL